MTLLLDMYDSFMFHQYGCKGWSMLANDMRKLSQARSLKDPKNSHLVQKLKDMGDNFDINFDLEKGKKDACERSYEDLAKLFGKDFTGEEIVNSKINPTPTQKNHLPSHFQINKHIYKNYQEKL